MDCKLQESRRKLHTKLDRKKIFWSKIKNGGSEVDSLCPWPEDNSEHQARPASNL